MKKINGILLLITLSLCAETLFEVKDAMNNPVLNVSTDGLRIMNEGDTLMVISSEEIRANIGTTGKGLSRAFSVTTTQSKGKGLINALQVDAGSTTMSAPLGKYTNFSPDNIFIGLNTGINSRPGQIEPYYGKYNTFLGNESGYSNTYGFGNIFIGYQAGYFSTTSNQNISIGYQAGYNMTGQSNTLVGHLVGKGTGSGGDYNSFYGRAAGFSIGTASGNTLIGALAGSALTNGSGNTLVGREAGKGQSSSSFSYNTVLGSSSATQLSTGGNNVVLGYNAGGSITTGSGNVFVGFQSGSMETGSNKLYIENSNSATPLIFGDFATDELTFNTFKTQVKHPLGSSYGLYIQNTYADNTDSWHFYQYSSDELSLYFNTSKRGDFDITSGAYTSVSDRRQKKNVKDFTGVLEKVLLLEPKRYNFISQNDGDSEYIGLIAQDVEKLFPEFVHYTEEDDTYTLDYAGLSVVAIQALKEQEKRIKRLEELLEKLSDK